MTYKTIQDWLDTSKDEGALDEMVIDQCCSMACGINNDGKQEQVEFLLGQRSLTHEEILEEINTKYEQI
jgi:hypothetical protein